MIKENVIRILAALPPAVAVVAAAKTRTPQEILEAVAAGVTIIGENYVQEAEAAFKVVGREYQGRRIFWHLLGRLQTNKAKRAVELFDLIETVDSEPLARAIDRCAAAAGKVMPILVEINSARETQKSGILPEDAEGLVRKIAGLPNIRVMGLMTMGPYSENPEDLQPAFALTKKIFEQIKLHPIPNVEMRFLSMGMSDSYRVAIEEGANLVRIGTAIFGERV
jgi:pyridoxal phosphate enzyme (YggS family)